MQMLMFDGEELIALDKEDLLTMPVDRLVSLYQSTAVFLDLVKDLLDLINDGSVKEICDYHFDKESYHSVVRGIDAIKERIAWVLGEDGLALIIEITEQNIKDVNNEDAA